MKQALLTGGALVLCALAVFLAWFGQATPWAQDGVVGALNDRFASQVELGSLQLSLLPRPRASGTGLTFRHNGRTDVLPLITIGNFDASASIFGLVSRPVHLNEVNITSLEIRVPRRPLPNEPAPAESNIEGLQAKALAPASRPPHLPHPEAPSPIAIDRVEARLVESTVVASGAVVRTEDVRGRGIVLDVRVDAGRIEDFTRLAVKADQPPLTGRMDMETSFLLLAGPQDVVDRLQRSQAWTKRCAGSL